jgi:hypothetical protein
MVGGTCKGAAVFSLYFQRRPARLDQTNFFSESRSPTGASSRLPMRRLGDGIVIDGHNDDRDEPARADGRLQREFGAFYNDQIWLGSYEFCRGDKRSAGIVQSAIFNAEMNDKARTAAVGARAAHCND